MTNLVLASILAFTGGLLIGWLAMWGRQAAVFAQLRASQKDAERLAGELDHQKSVNASQGQDVLRLERELAATQASTSTQINDLKGAYERFEAAFAKVSATALSANSSEFLKLAEQAFAGLHKDSVNELATRQTAIGELVKPLKDSLEKVDQKIGELEQSRERAYGKLGQQLESLNEAQQRMMSEASKFSAALSTTRTAGTWGEVQLRRVVELSGMIEHCDFAEQQSLAHEEGRHRPDLIVYLPGGRRIAVDAKAPTTAFREAAAESDPAQRSARLKEHAQRIREHIDALAAREYWATIEPSPDYVILFLPGDSFLAAAIESDPAIMDRAMARKVLLATPMTLIAFLKAAHYGWNQEALSKNAEEIGAVGRQLYDRAATFMDHLSGASRGLTTAVRNLNNAIGSFDGSLIPSMRKLEDLGAKGSKQLDAPERVEVEVREIAKRG